MPQIGYPLSQAHEALEQFLNDGERMHNGERYERWIGSDDSDSYGEALAYIVPADAMHKMRQGYHNWLDSEEQKAENSDLPPGYRPWRHSPLATTDRLLPHEPLHKPLARYMYGKDFEELGQDERDRITGAAIVTLLRVTLDPDGQGAVPIMMAGHDHDEPGGGIRWRISFATDVPGLYVHTTGNGWFGEEWAIVTGSGYRLAGGWYSKEGASVCVAALGRLLPNVDWMRLTPSAFTPASMKAIAETVKRYGPWSDTDKREPDPEPLTEAVPADSGLPEADSAAISTK